MILERLSSLFMEIARGFPELQLNKPKIDTTNDKLTPLRLIQGYLCVHSTLGILLKLYIAWDVVMEHISFASSFLSLTVTCKKEVSEALMFVPWISKRNIH